MNNHIKGSEIINLFNELNRKQINYLLIRNINNELPYNLERKKDIDLLIQNNAENKEKFYKILKKLGYKTILHPNRNDTFLYSTNKFIFKYNKKNDIYLDIQYDILCRSLNKGEWLPLDEKIQTSSWENRQKKEVGEFVFWSLSDEDELICLIARSILDKRKFLNNYKKRIVELYSQVNIEDLIPKLELIFFKYTPKLLGQIQKKEFDSVLDNYIKYKEY